MAWKNDVLFVGDLLAGRGGMHGLKDVLSTVAQYALQELTEDNDGRPDGCGPLGMLGGPERDAERVTPKDGNDPGGRCRGEAPQASDGFARP